MLSLHLVRQNNEISCTSYDKPCFEPKRIRIVDNVIVVVVVTLVLILVVIIVFIVAVIVALVLALLDFKFDSFR